MAANAGKTPNSSTIARRYFVCLLLILPLVAIPSSWLLYMQLTNVNHFSVTGLVVRHDTLDPAAGARVVVTSWPRTLKGGGQEQFGLVTDEQGLFHLNTSVSRPISEITLEVVTPDGQYCFKECGQFPDVGRVTLRVTPLPEKWKDEYAFQFDTFSGRKMPGLSAYKNDFTFIGTHWEVRHPAQLEIGAPFPEIRAENDEALDSSGF